MALDNPYSTLWLLAVAQLIYRCDPNRRHFIVTVSVTGFNFKCGSASQQLSVYNAVVSGGFRFFSEVLGAMVSLFHRIKLLLVHFALILIFYLGAVGPLANTAHVSLCQS